MQTLIILGAGQFGRSFVSLINRNHYQLLAFGDNNSSLWNTDISTALGPVPVISIEQAASFQPDLMLIAVSDKDRSEALIHQAKNAGYQNQFMLLQELYQTLDIRSATLHRMAERITSQHIEGSIAELGVYKGDIAWQLNTLFPDRELLLFDTFEGFDEKDISTEKANDYSRAEAKNFSDTSVEFVQSRLPFPDHVTFRQGYFPQTTEGLSDRFYALVSLDTDLYDPILAGLEYFYPRLSKGGMILLHDYNNAQFRGCKEAVCHYEQQHEPLLLVPLSDLHGTAVIIKS